jgi:hypothetical protein
MMYRESAMSSRALVALALSALIPLAACDLTQKPQTVAVRATTSSVSETPRVEAPTPGAPQVEMQWADANGHAQAGSNRDAERSLRLQGPGVSRDKQTRI